MAVRQHLLRKDRDGHDRHPEEAHHPEHEEHDHQAAGTADAVKAVRKPSPKSAAAIVGAAATVQTEPFQRGQLVDPSRDDHGARDVRAALVPYEPTDVE